MKGSVCGCCPFTLPNASRIFPTFVRKPPGRVGKVMKPSSSATSSGPSVTKKSARA